MLKLNKKDEDIDDEGEGYNIYNEGIACKPMIINKFRLLAIGVLSKNNLAKKTPPTLNVRMSMAKKVTKI